MLLKRECRDTVSFFLHSLYKNDLLVQGKCQDGIINAMND